MLMIHISKYDNVDVAGDYVVDRKFKHHKTAYNYLIKKGFTADEPSLTEFSKETENGPEWATICEVLPE